MISAKVAKVIDDRGVVLNKGQNDGVEVGMRFAILEPKALVITDPDTGKALEKIDVEKATVKVSEVYDHVSIARTFRVIPGRPSFADSILASYAFAGRPSRVETFETDEPDAWDELDPEQRRVHVGDVAVQRKGNE